jgi:transcription elongation factor Elf1
MMCPECASITAVKATVKEQEYHRLRYCSSCGYVFQTVEAPIGSPYWDEYKANIEE